MRPFEELLTGQQVHRLRRSAFETLSQYPVEVQRLRLLYHGFNTTFRVDTTDGRRFALRLNVNSRRTPANLRAEIAWLAALAEDTNLNVPSPQRTLDGSLRCDVYSTELGRHLPAALFSWLPGADLGDEATTQQMRAVGRAAATLHTHAESWTLPEGAELPPINTPLIDVPNHISDLDHPLLTPPRREVIDAAFIETQRRYDEVFANARPHALHADLHNGNLKWCRGQLSVFDFDDSGMGLPMQDLAIAAYYLRDEMELEAALLDGYQELRPLPTYTEAQYEAMVASRNLILLNDVFVIATAEIRSMLPRYVPNSVTKLRYYLDRGVYRHDVPGLIEAT
jgi:Ser/Thr protein kinase RdoA (MazF antagonist)